MAVTYDNENYIWVAHKTISTVETASPHPFVMYKPSEFDNPGNFEKGIYVIQYVQINFQHRTFN